MLSVDQVLDILSQIATPLPTRETPLEQALGAVLAREVRMRDDSPPFDRAQLDGFAVRSADFADSLPATLRIIAHLDAGATRLPPPLKEGECVGINTGAQFPPGADAILMVEYSERAHVNPTVRATSPVSPGYGIQRRGSDARAGQTVLSPGRTLGPAELAVCATAGAATLHVRRLTASLLVTGDELVDPSQTPQPGQIRNSNHPMLAALLRTHAGDLLDLGTCPDDAPRLRDALQRGLQHSDLLVVSGGMSMGTRDLVPPLLKDLGVQFHVEKVRIKPGKPLVLGSWRSDSGDRTTFVVGLPGNPVSAFVTFHRFVRPLIQSLLGKPRGGGGGGGGGGGEREGGPRGAEDLIEARAGAPLPANGEREFYQPCRLRRDGPLLIADPLSWKGSSDLFTLVEADGLLVRPVHAPAIQAADPVQVLPLRGL
jgi:molybdopterin molybdotransferase